MRYFSSNLKKVAQFFLVTLLMLTQSVFVPFAQASSIFEAMTVAEERELGEKVDVMMKTKAPLLFDPYILGYLERMVERLSKNITAQPFELEVNLIYDKRINAFATAGGFLYVNSGLFLTMENESELAGVVGHEIAHITQRHIAKRQQKSTLAMLTSILTAAAAALAASQGGGNLAAGAMSGGVAAGQSIMLAYSRQDENEADTVGYEYLVKAGYDPQAFVTAFRKLQAQSFGAKGVPTYLSTHPDLSDRIVFLDSRIRAEGKNFKVKKQDNREFLQVQSFLRAQVDTIANAKHYLDKLNQDEAYVQIAQALLAAREHKTDKAEKHYTNALQKEPNNALYLREYGYFHYDLGDISVAYDMLKKSARLNSRDLMTKFHLARVEDALNMRKEAQKNYHAILKEYPYDEQVHRYLGHSYGRSDNQFEGYLHLAYSSLFNYENRNADKQFKQAEKLAKTPKQEEAIKKFKKTRNYFEEKTSS